MIGKNKDIIKYSKNITNTEGGPDKKQMQTLKKMIKDEFEKSGISWSDFISSVEPLVRKSVKDAKKKMNESVEKDLGESAGDMEKAAAELEAYAKKSGGMDKNTFMRVATLLKTGHPDKLKSYINSMDTDPREYVAMLLKKHVGNKSAEKMLDIKFRGESISAEDAETLLAAGVTEEISGSGYELYHKTLGSAIDTAITHAKLKFGIDITDDERMDQVGMGPRKPSNGKTNTYRLMGNKGKAIQVQVFNRGGPRPYELNMYKE